MEDSGDVAFICEVKQSHPHLRRDEDLAAALELFLNLEGWKTVVFHDAKSFLTGDRPSVPGCLILDVKMPGFSGLECQALMKEHGVKLPVIFITGHGNIDMAVQAVLDGACDFCRNPWMKSASCVPLKRPPPVLIKK